MDTDSIKIGDTVIFDMKSHTPGKVDLIPARVTVVAVRGERVKIRGEAGTCSWVKAKNLRPASES
jgi:hypothetical protein